MIKLIRTLIQGRAFEAERDLADRHAELLLGQQIRDAAATINSARRAVAVAMARHEQERLRSATIVARIEDIEARTVVALEKGDQALAHEAAATIAHLEAERDTAQNAEVQFGTAVGKLREVVRLAEGRLQELQRGETIARATGAVQKLESLVGDHGLSSLYEAEETLGRLRERQAQNSIATAVLTEMGSQKNPAVMIEKLAKAGCGGPLRSSAEDVLARLRGRMSPAH